MQAAAPIDRSVFYELAAFENLLCTCPAHYMKCQDIERVVLAVAGKLVPQLQQAIDTQSKPVLPTVAAILAGEFPDVSEMLLSAPRQSIPYRVDAYVLTIDMKDDGTVAACKIWERDSAGNEGALVLSV